MYQRFEVIIRKHINLNAWMFTVPQGLSDPQNCMSYYQTERITDLYMIYVSGDEKLFILILIR